MSSDQVFGVFQLEATRVGATTAQMVSHVTQHHQMTLDGAISTAAASGFSIGVELGLQIAIADIAAGRMLQRFFHDLRTEAHAAGVLSADEDHSDEARAEMAQRFLTVLR